VLAHNGLLFEVKVPKSVTLSAMKEADFGKLPIFATIQDLFTRIFRHKLKFKHSASFIEAQK